MAGKTASRKSSKPHIRARRRGAFLTLAAVMATALVLVVRFAVGPSSGRADSNQIHSQQVLGGDSSTNISKVLARVAARISRSSSLTPGDLQRIEVIRKRYPYISKAGNGKRLVALTFDDGPGPYTLRVAHELERLHVPATFFQVGSEMHDFGEAAKEVAANPLFVLGNHTENHRALPQLSRRDQLDQIVTANEMMRRYGEAQPLLFRPPYGAINETTFSLLEKEKLLPVFWSVDSEDYQRPGVAKIVRNVVESLTPGGIVLMHDAGGDRSQTVAAIPKIVRILRRRGYQFVTVPQLLLQSPPPLQQPRPPAGIG